MNFTNHGNPKTSEEKEKQLLRLKTLMPEISHANIAATLDMGQRTVGKVLERINNLPQKKYESWLNQQKKEIDSLRSQMIRETDTQLMEALRNKKLTPFQLIGMTKVLYEQTWPALAKQVNVQVGDKNLVVEFSGWKRALETAKK